jgi:hypothetical protein
MASYAIVFLLLANASFSQKFSMDDIMTVYAMDSMALQAFCTEKQFVRARVEEDQYKVSHYYKSTADKAISFIRTFPKRDPEAIHLYYYFANRKDYHNYKDSVKLYGFKKFREFDFMGGHREGYGTDKLELEFATSNTAKRNWTIMLYKRVNFK